MRISTTDRLQAFFSRQVGEVFAGILQHIFFHYPQPVAVGGKEMYEIVAVALGIGKLAGSPFTGGRDQLHHIFPGNGFYRRQIVGQSALPFQPGLETGREVKLRIVRNKAEPPATRSIGFDPQQAPVPVFHQIIHSQMVLGSQVKPDSRIDNDFEAMTARTDPAGHRIGSLAHQPEQTGQIGLLLFVEIEDNQRIVGRHTLYQAFSAIGGRDGYGRQSFLQLVGSFGILFVHIDADTVNRRGILAITDIGKDVDQIDVAHTGSKPGKHSNFYHNR